MGRAEPRSRPGGAADVVTHQRTAFCCRLGNRRYGAEAIADLAERPDERNRWGEQPASASPSS
jgi:hypothetical protein